MENEKEKFKKQYYILIDESGTLPDPKDKFVVITGVGLRELKEGKNLISRILKSLRQRKIKVKKVKEVKFYYAGERTKRQILSGIVLAGFEIFTIIVDKKRRKISDTPENFSLLVSELINEVNLWQPKRNLKIIIDRHFHRESDEKNFNKLLQKNIKNSLGYGIQHTDSQQNFIINLADFAAGAILSKYNKNNFQFYDIIKESILLEKIVNWPELKRKSLEF
ncbi:DUF3800 domain-containing protein [Patescibacteria group bacterium]|nr:DUF3800 domain-containing protein [Patescibacteria group bacterium]MBU4481361.1 DUF3800 domain-containing protein [Patescibacteria group bacterium]